MKHAVEILLTLSTTFKGSADQQSVDAKTDFGCCGCSSAVMLVNSAVLQYSDYRDSPSFKCFFFFIQLKYKL